MAPRGHRPDRHEDRVQRGPLRRLHRPDRRRPSALVHHAHPPSGRRGDDDRGSPRACDGGRVRPGGRAPVRLLHPRPDRLGDCARCREPHADAGGGPPRDGGEPLPLRHVSQDRGGNRVVARLIKTEKEVEGRYTEQWVVVDEDALEQWPAGAGDTVGRPAPRQDGYQRARGEAQYTADIQLPGMLYAAILRSPFARARIREIDLRMAEKAPGVRAVLGPDTSPLTDEPAYQGAPVAAVAADTDEQARAAMRLIEVEWEELEPLLDPDEAVRRNELVEEPNHHERGDIERGLAEAD